MTLAIDGSAVEAVGSGHTLALPGLTTTVAGDVIVVNTLNNYGGAVSVTSPHLTFTPRVNPAYGADEIGEFYAISPRTLSSEVITIACVNSAGYLSACAFAISGADTGPYDLNTSLPAASGTAPVSISTSQPSTMILGAFRHATNASPTAESGFTLISGANYLCSEYKVETTAQSGLSVGDGGNSDVNGAIVDALTGPSPAIDGSAVTAVGSGHTLALPGLTTTVAGDVIVVNTINNYGGAVSVTSPHLTFTPRVNPAYGADEIGEFYAISPGTLSSEVITITCVNSAGYLSACAFAVKGVNPGPFDLNSSLPATSGSAPVTISTTAANTMILGAFRQATVTSPGAASGFTLISGANYLCSEYKIESTAQSGLSVGDGSNSDVNGAIADAIVIAPSGGPGPAASGSFVNADFTNLTGSTVVRELFGGSTATLMDNGWALCSDSSFQAASLAINPPLVRFNCNSGGSGSTGTWAEVFGTPPGTPDWTGPDVFIANAHLMFNLATTKIILGIGGLSQTGTDGDTMGATTAQFACMAQQIVDHFATTTGGDGNIVPIAGVEIMNEWDGRLTPSQYESYFHAAAVAIHSIAPNMLMYGPVTANNGSDISSWLALANATDFNGSLDDHAYSKCPQDPNPTDNEVAQALNGGAGTVPNGWAANISTIVSGTFAAAYRMFNGEYNIDCASGDSRQQDWRGALFACSWVNKLVDGAASGNVVEAGIWEYGTAGNHYGLFVGSSGSWSPTPQASYLSKAAQVCPGARCVTSNPGASDALSWSTVNGTHFSTTIVNPDSSAISGPVALSHWPVNGSGNGTVNVWTVSSAHPNGQLTTGVSVTAGMTASITIPALGMVIIYD
jgi:hypothetical protein